MTIASEFDPQRGIIRLPRRHLEALVTGDPAVRDPGGEPGDLLAEIGMVAGGRLDDALTAVVSVLRRPASRFGLRIQSAGRVERHRGWIAGRGIVVVSGGTEPDDVQDLRSSSRPTAATRLLATLLGLGPSGPPGALPGGPIPWREVMAPVEEADASGWAAAAFGAEARPRLGHLRWSRDGHQPATTVMVLLLAGEHGVVEAVRAGDLFRLVPRSPTEVWTGLCALAAPARPVSDAAGMHRLDNTGPPC